MPCNPEASSLLFAKAENEINFHASSLAKAFLASLNESERLNEKLSFKKVFLAFKFNETPNEVLLKGLKEMADLEQIRGYFKKLAKLLHPDKNNHPLAKSSFQKLQDATNSALLSFSNAAPKTANDFWSRQEHARSFSRRNNDASRASNFFRPAF